MRILPLLALGLFPVGRCAAQEPWLAEVPSAQKVATAYQSGASRLGAAKAAEAMYALTNVIGSLGGAGGLSPAAQGRIAELNAGQQAVLNAQYEKDRETYKVHQCEQAYAESPEFHRELLDQFFSPQWISTWGPKLDVRRWKRPLAMPAGTRPPANLLPACGPGPSQVAGNASAAPGRTESGPAAAEADGLKRMAAKDYKGARTAFRAAIAADPKRAPAFVYLGDTWYQEMLALAGGKDSVAYSRAFDLAWDSSSAAWAHAVALKPQDAKLLVDIGDRQRELDPSTGYEAYSQALDLKPDAQVQSKAWAGLGWMARFLTMEKDALTYFNNAARLDWKNADAAWGLGLSLAKAGAKGPAMAQYRKLLQLGDTMKANSVLEEINTPR